MGVERYFQCTPESVLVYDLDRWNAAREEGAGVEEGAGLERADAAGQFVDGGAAAFFVGVVFACAGTALFEVDGGDGGEIGEGAAFVERAEELVAGFRKDGVAERGGSEVEADEAGVEGALGKVGAGGGVGGARGEHNGGEEESGAGHGKIGGGRRLGRSLFDSSSLPPEDLLEQRTQEEDEGKHPDLLPVLEGDGLEQGSGDGEAEGCENTARDGEACGVAAPPGGDTKQRQSDVDRDDDGGKKLDKGTAKRDVGRLHGHHY